jgi:hypothetical protein
MSCPNLFEFRLSHRHLNDVSKGRVNQTRLYTRDARDSTFLREGAPLDPKCDPTRDFGWLVGDSKKFEASDLRSYVF